MAAIYNDKILDAIALTLKARFLCLEGTARSGKTMSISDAFYYAVRSSAEKFHVIAGRDLDAIRNNILYDDAVGLMTLHPNCLLKKDKIGGYYVSIIGLDGREKEIILVNYSTETSWKKILGNTLGCIYVDEVNIASKTFIEECFARQLSADNPHTYWTLNGDDPNHWCYQEYINYCKMIGKVPPSIRQEMEKFQEKKEVKKGYYYMHFVMSDNPVMTPEKIEAAMRIYPPGSYYHTTKILGERGIQGDLLFMDYMHEDLIVDAFEVDMMNRKKYPFIAYSFGADVGAGRAFNSLHLIGYLSGYKAAVVLEEYLFDAKGYDKKKPLIYSFIDRCMKAYNILPRQVDGFMLDSAEQNFIADLVNSVYEQFQIQVVGSYKATIKDRIDMMSIGFSTGRIKFHKACRKTYDAYYRAQRGKESFTRLDTDVTNATGDNDRMDSCEYALTRHMKALMSNGGDFR